MTKEQEESVRLVYRNFMSHDLQRNWTNVDEILYNLDFLTDEETIIETETQIFRHSEGSLKCIEDHEQSACMVPQLIESVDAICELYNETRVLHPKNRYVLQNYLAAAHEGIIYVEPTK